MTNNVLKFAKIAAVSTIGLGAIAVATPANATMLLHAELKNGTCKVYETGIGTGSNTYRFDGRDVRVSVRFDKNGQRLIQKFTNALKPVARRILKDPDVVAVKITGYGNRTTSVTYGKTARPVIVGDTSADFKNCTRVRSVGANDGNQYVPSFGKNIQAFVNRLN